MVINMEELKRRQKYRRDNVIQIKRNRRFSMNRTIYVNKDTMEVKGCIIYDDAVPVRMCCEGCTNEKFCIYRKIVFEDE